MYCVQVNCSQKYWQPLDKLVPNQTDAAAVTLVNFQFGKIIKYPLPLFPILNWEGGSLYCYTAPFIYTHTHTHTHTHTRCTSTCTCQLAIAIAHVTGELTYTYECVCMCLCCVAVSTSVSDTLLASTYPVCVHA